MPLLAASGSAPLVWWKLRGSDLRTSDRAGKLQQAYCWQTIVAALRERDIGQVFSLLRSAGVEPLLGKGWAAARLYPEPGLRPYGDIDLYVAAEQEATVLGRLTSTATSGKVDVHGAEHELDDRGFAELMQRSRLAPLGDTEVRTLGPEDHLRLLCLHFLRHGAWRPLWLCDIGAAIEQRPADFAWGYFLSGDQRRTEWVIGAIGLAQRLLGARLDGTPIADQAARLPRWLVPAVLRQWGKGKDLQSHGECLPWSTIIRRPVSAPEVLGSRWPSPISATVSRRAPLNELPRLPIQLTDWLGRGVSLVPRRVARVLMGAASPCAGVER